MTVGHVQDLTVFVYPEFVIIHEKFNHKYLARLYLNSQTCWHRLGNLLIRIVPIFCQQIRSDIPINAQRLRMDKYNIIFKIFIRRFDFEFDLLTNGLVWQGTYQILGWSRGLVVGLASSFFNFIKHCARSSKMSSKKKKSAISDIIF